MTAPDVFVPHMTARQEDGGGTPHGNHYWGEQVSYFDDSVVYALNNLRDPGMLASVLRRVWNGPLLRLSGPFRSEVQYVNYKPFERARLVLSLQAQQPAAGSNPATAEFVFEVKADTRPWDREPAANSTLR